jgi:glycine/D-amino acid oxidase-like deaminating enzyme
MKTIIEPERKVSVAYECDLCVAGGSCTGVFAAITAARLGLRVALVEQQGMMGGTATAGLVALWHSLYDMQKERQIIGGLTDEIIERLEARGAAVWNGEQKKSNVTFNPSEMAIMLDRMAEEAGIRVFLHARACRPLYEGGKLDALLLEDKSGRRAVRARYFVDATGDADLIHRMGLPTRTEPVLQPPTTPILLQGMKRWCEANPGIALNQVVFDSAYSESLPKGFLWSTRLPGLRDALLTVGTRVHGADCSDADQLTRAEIAGRRQASQIRDLLRNNFSGGEEIEILALPAHIGIRQTRQACCLHTLTEHEVLHGVGFDDAIARGTYPVDIHNGAGGGILFRNLDGSEIEIGEDLSRTARRWREEGKVTPFYQIPYRSLVPQGAENVLVAGRCLDADRGAFGAVRVMVNCNQTGEAAGAACALACRNNCPVSEVDARAIAEKLNMN